MKEPFCWICEQKAQYFREKLHEVLKQALKQAQGEKKIIAIWKEGPTYKFGSDADAGDNEILQYISEHSQIATL